MFLSFEHSCFGYCFVFRASDFEFLTEKPGFSVSHWLGKAKPEKIKDPIISVSRVSGIVWFKR